jgi:hypothetical protein
MTTCGGDPLLFYVDFPGFALLTIFQLLALVHWGDHQTAARLFMTASDVAVYAVLWLTARLSARWRQG